MIKPISFKSIKIKGEFSKYPEIKKSFINSEIYKTYSSSKDSYISTLKSKKSKQGIWLSLEINETVNKKPKNIFGIYATAPTKKEAQEKIINLIL
ncbi:hypothetical protein IJ670_05625 [bacterium]|nr:hypothetical protein [bacterium]